MQFRHIVLAISLMAIWGLNFVFVSYALQALSPFFLCFCRFFLASIPLVFFIKRPKTSWGLLIAYGLLIFFVQFVLMFLGMKAGVSAGLAGLLAQVQVFFSIFLSALFFKERITFFQLIGAIVAFWGVIIVFCHTGGQMTVSGIGLVLGAALAWASGSLISKKIGAVDPMSLVVWGSFIAAIPLAPICYFSEGPGLMWSTLNHLSGLCWLSLFYISYLSTWFGYAVWSQLLSKYIVSTVVPFTFLVPVFAMVGSIIFLDESFVAWKGWACVLVILGLIINVVGARFFSGK